MALGWKDKNDNIFWKCVHAPPTSILCSSPSSSTRGDIQTSSRRKWFYVGHNSTSDWWKYSVFWREHTLHNLDWANNKSGCRLFCDVLAYSLHQIFNISTSTDRFGFILLHNVYSTIPVSNGSGGEILTNTKFITFSLIWSPSLIACKYRYRIERFWIYTKASKHYLFSFKFSILDIKFRVKA